VTYRLHSLNTRTQERTTGLTVYPEYIARALAARLNEMPAMVKEGIVYSAEPACARSVGVKVQPAPRPNYRAYLRGEQ